jgi:hypothetical protein
VPHAQRTMVPHIDSWIADRSARQDSKNEVPRRLEPAGASSKQSGSFSTIRMRLIPKECNARNNTDRPGNWPRLTHTPCAELLLGR